MSAKAIGELLREPFSAESLGWKPQATKGNRALAVAYIDARDVMDRLDKVVGVENWQDEYTPLPNGQVMCRLSVRFGTEWIAKTDVGGESEQPDKGDREKAAFSDALKRAAVKFGIGRYLYSMPAVWCDYDPVKKQFVDTPRLDARFLPPDAKPAPSPAPRSGVRAESRDEFLYLLDGVNAATSPEALAAAWSDVNAAAKSSRLTDAQSKELVAAKDARKAAIANGGKLFDNSKPTGVPH